MPARAVNGRVAVVAFALLFAAVTTGITWAEHWTYNSTSLDMAVYTQLVWDLADGDPFATTLLLQNRLHLAEHLALLLLPLAPLYALVARVELLLVLQQVALALSGLPVYWVARCRLGERPALLVLAAYYAMPTLAEVALDAFYPIAFAALPVSWAAAFALLRRPRAAALSALLATLFEEEAALLALGIGLYLLITAPLTRRIGLALLLSGAVWLGLVESLVMPGYHQPSTAGQETRAEDHFRQLRTQPLAWLGQVAINRLEPELIRASGLARPPNRLEPCSQPGHCSALRWWLYPTAGLALLSPTTLVMSAPPAAALLLADRPGRFRRHWAAPMLPVIWLATTAGLGLWSARPRLRVVGSAALLAASLLMYRLDSPLPLGSQYETDDVVPSAVGRDLAQLAGELPPRASVIASRRGLAHLANRSAVYAFPPTDYGPGLWPPPERPEYALLDLRNGDTVEELNRTGGTLPGYAELRRTPNALLLRRSS